jgi:hypothetical protein
LEELTCYSNPALASINVTKNPKLTVLLASGGSLTTINLSGNPELKNLNIGDNSLMALDLTNNPALTTLSCAGNKIISLDLSSNPMIAQIICSKNNLTTLNLANNLKLTTDLIAKWNAQSSHANYFSPDGGITNYIDMSEVVGKENINKIRSVVGGSYDVKSGLIHLNSPLPNTVTYYYDTQSVFADFVLSPGDRVVNVPKSDMDVTLSLASSVAPIFEVVFLSSEGVEISKMNVTKGTLLTKPDNPEKAGFRFLGWYFKDAWEELNVWDFNTPVTSDMQLFQVWQPDDPENPDDSVKPEKPDAPAIKPGADGDNPTNPEIPAAGSNPIFAIIAALLLSCVGLACLSIAYRSRRNRR